MTREMVHCEELDRYQLSRKESHVEEESFGDWWHSFYFMTRFECSSAGLIFSE